MVFKGTYIPRVCIHMRPKWDMAAAEFLFTCDQNPVPVQQSPQALSVGQPFLLSYIPIPPKCGAGWDSNP